MTNVEKRKAVLELVGEASLLMIGDEPVNHERTIQIVDEIMALFERPKPSPISADGLKSVQSLRAALAFALQDYKYRLWKTRAEALAVMHKIAVEEMARRCQEIEDALKSEAP